MGRHLAEALKDCRIYPFDFPHLAGSLAQAQPVVFLDVFLADNDIRDHQLRRIFSRDPGRSGGPFDQIPGEVLLSWCENDPVVRYPLVASVIEPFQKTGETGRLEWKPVVHAFLRRAPRLDAVLAHISDAIWPRLWSGSRADIVRDRSVLLQDLYQHDNPEIGAWARSRYSALQEAIKVERESEERRNRERDERFE
jgi:hypothetical protein